MVEGVAEFRARMRSILPAIEKEVRAELEVVAAQLVAEMRSIAPVEFGDLRASIGWSWGGAPKGTISVGSVASGSGSSMRITIYAGGGHAFHARFQEFGTVKMAANPFFFPIYRANKTRIKARLSRAVTRAIKKV